MTTATQPAQPNTQPGTGVSEEALMSIVQDADNPLTVSAIHKAVRGRPKPPRDAVQSLLIELVQQGKLNQYQPFGRGGVRFWD